MKPIIVSAAFAALTFVSTAIATIQFSSEHEARFLMQQDQLQDDLIAWKNSPAGKTAIEQGLFVEKTGVNALDDQLRRLYTTKMSLDRLHQANPKAKFSIFTPFSLMTDEEFTSYTKGSFLQQSNVLKNNHEPNTAKKARNTPRNNRSRSSDCPYPTEEPTPSPTDSPTPYPTDSPTPYPTDSPSPSPSYDVDWSATGCMNPIKSQGQCGSCWAFASVGTIETAQCIKMGQLQIFSEQQVTSCETSRSYGCSGGWPDAAINYAVSSGLCLESEYPYTSGDTSDTGSCSTNCYPVSLSVTNATFVEAKSDSALITALNAQTVVVLVSAGNRAWQQYTSGVLSACDSSDVDHAVIAVGYNSESYKVRNSWGTSWGEEGYVRLSRTVNDYGTGVCEVLTAPVYPQM